MQSRTNGAVLIPLVVSLSNHDRNQLVQVFLKNTLRYFPKVMLLQILTFQVIFIIAIKIDDACRGQFDNPGRQ